MSTTARPAPTLNDRLHDPDDKVFKSADDWHWLPTSADPDDHMWQRRPSHDPFAQADIVNTTHDTMDPLGPGGRKQQLGNRRESSPAAEQLRHMRKAARAQKETFLWA